LPPSYESGCSKLGMQDAVLHRALGQALRLGLIVRNPADALDPPRKAKYEIQPHSAEQSRRLLQTARGDRLDALYVLTLTTGMRQGELLGLRWRDVDAAQGKLHVRGTLGRTREIGEPKSAKGNLLSDSPSSKNQGSRALPGAPSLCG
jgi:integrase